jgi:hypothetical protein
MAPGTTKERIFRMSFLSVAVVWIALILAHQLAKPALGP